MGTGEVPPEPCWHWEGEVPPEPYWIGDFREGEVPPESHNIADSLCNLARARPSTFGLCLWGQVRQRT